MAKEKRVARLWIHASGVGALKLIAQGQPIILGTYDRSGALIENCSFYVHEIRPRPRAEGLVIKGTVAGNLPDWMKRGTYEFTTNVNGCCRVPKGMRQ